LEEVRVMATAARATLTVTAKGQVTLRKEVLKHLGIKPGDKIEIEYQPDGEIKVHAARPKRSWDEIFGLLKGKTTKVATLEEIQEAIEKGWAGQL
jgi:AbrB family looped-hinge helix DNA binding protein